MIEMIQSLPCLQTVPSILLGMLLVRVPWEYFFGSVHSVCSLRYFKVSDAADVGTRMSGWVEGM